MSNSERRRQQSRDGREGEEKDSEMETEEKIGFCDLQDVKSRNCRIMGPYWRREIQP